MWSLVPMVLSVSLSLWTGATGVSSNVGRGVFAAKLDLRGAVASKVEPFRQRLANRVDLQYFGQITLGGQQVDAIFDTGSFDVLVVSQKCDQCPHPQYNSSFSASYHSLNMEANHTFGSGKTTSHMGEDELRVGPLHVESQVIHEIVRHEIKMLDSASFDAIVGIGPKGPGSTCNMSLLCNLHMSEFSICLERGKGSPGWLTWGSRLTAAEKAGGVELANIGKHHWTVSLRDVWPTGLQLDAKNQKAASALLCENGCAAVIDSGTSLIAGPSHAIDRLQHLIPLNSDCSNFQDMPDLEFTLNGHLLRLPKESYVMKLIGSYPAMLAVSGFLHFKPTTLLQGTCFLNFMAMDRSTEFGPLWILGMPFFRQYHVTFGLHENASERKIWLNKASPACEPEPLREVKQNKTWRLADAVYKGVDVYPRMGVAQTGSTVQHSSTPLDASQVSPASSSGPMTVRAEDLLASGGLRPRLEKWNSMKYL